MTGIIDRNAVLLAMQRLQDMFCATWTEAVWALVDANRPKTKFIISDHPVTVYNRDCFPLSQWCRDFNDPDIRFVGTQTLFPLSPSRVLILTNMSWVRNRNPYVLAIKPRPNPALFRSAMFSFTSIQVGRELAETEVNQINFIIKKRAYRYIAATTEEALYPERFIPSEHWRKLDDRYVLMPDPRSVTFTDEMMIGYRGGGGERFDAFGQRPGQSGFKKKMGTRRGRITRMRAGRRPLPLERRHRCLG
jgi:hypothetical protein